MAMSHGHREPGDEQEEERMLREAMRVSSMAGAGFSIGTAPIWQHASFVDALSDGFLPRSTRNRMCARGVDTMVESVSLVDVLIDRMLKETGDGALSEDRRAPLERVHACMQNSLTQTLRNFPAASAESHSQSENFHRYLQSLVSEVNRLKMGESIFIPAGSCTPLLDGEARRRTEPSHAGEVAGRRASLERTA